MASSYDFSWNDHIKLKKKCDKIKIDYVASCFDPNSVDFYMDEIKGKIMKIASSEIDNLRLLSYVNKRCNKVILSTGMSNINEIRKAVQTLKKVKNLTLLQCTSVYPAPINELNINAVTTLRKFFKLPIGFSDHSLGNVASMVSIGAGCRLIEKHFTDNRKFKRTDYQSALDATQIKNFLINFDIINKNLKESNSVAKFENMYRNMFKKSCAFRNDKIQNQTIKESDFKFIKSKKNKSYFFSHNLVGKKVKKTISKNSVILTNHLHNKIGAIITVRTSSKRYPQKALKKINNVESIRLVIRRVKKLNFVNDIILATSTDKSDTILAKIAKEEGIKIFRGSLNNVVNRYYMCAKKFKLDYVVRVTGDAILCDENMLNKAISSHLKTNADVTFLRNMPYGTAKEVISTKVLKVINDKSVNKDDTEYLEFFLENKKYFKINYIKSNYKFNKDIRLTLDFPQDRVLFDKIYRYFDDKQSNFSLKDVLKFLKDKPKLIRINNFLQPKFDKTQINTELSI